MNSIQAAELPITDYQTCSNEELFERTRTAKKSLGDQVLILGHNYQATEWYEDSYALLTGQGLELRAVGDNWLAAIYRQVIRGEWL